MEAAPPGDVKMTEVLSSWDIGRDAGAEEIKPGLVYRIHRGKSAPLILKNIGEGISSVKERFAFEIEVLRFLDERGVPVSVPLKTAAGDRFLEKNGRIYTLSPCLKAVDSRASLGRRSARLLNEHCGAAIGRLDRALAAFPRANLEKKTWTTNLPVDLHDRWIPEIEKYASPIERSGLSSLMEETEGRAWKNLAGLPGQLIHRDCHQGNIIVDGSRVLGFIDFDHLSIGPRPFDLAYFIAHMIQDGIETSEGSKRWFALFPAVVRGFNKENPLTGDDLASIPSFMAALFIMFAGWFFEIGNFKEARSRLARFRWVHKNLIEIEEAATGALA